MLNYTGEAVDGRRQLTIISRLARWPRVALWVHVGGAYYVIACGWRRTYVWGKRRGR